MIYGNEKLLIYTDGASRGNPGHSAYGFILIFENGEVVHEESGYIGKTTNNRAEYRAVINALEKAKDFHDGRVKVFSDSKLLVQQMKGFWSVKNPRIRKLHGLAKKRTRQFEKVWFEHVPRENSYVSRADELCNEKLDEKNF